MQNPSSITLPRNRFVRCLVWALIFQVIALPSWSLPQDGVVVGGEATIHAIESNRLNITQHSKRAVIDWRSFSIDRGEHTHFDQLSRNSVIVNRVVGNDVSKIFGSMSARGKVVLVNRHGIHVGPDARIDVAGFVATTADISNQDAMSGNFRFDWAGNPEGYVLNEGTITAAEGGLIGLVAPWVENRGTLEARLGKVILASGDTFTLDLFGDQLFELAISDASADRLRGLESSGHIEANGGEVVLMTASAAGAVVESVLNVSGIVEAHTVAEIDGRIVLQGSGNSIVNLAGTLDASGDDAGEMGGTVEVTGGAVVLHETARIDVSGDTGGGVAHVGGAAHGEGALVNAHSLEIAEGAVIVADANDSGDGGEVVLWSDGRTDFAGRVSARGAEGGHGGFAEVSGREGLGFSGEVELGSGGTLLLDPLTLTVDESLALQLRRSLIDGTSVELLASDSVTINSAIDGRVTGGGTPGGGVFIETDTGAVAINADIITNNGTIEIVAGGDIVMAADLGGVTGGDGVVFFVSDGLTGLGDAPIDLQAGGRVDLQWIATGGDIDISAFDSLNVDKRIDGGGDSIRLTSTSGSVNISADVVARNSRILITANEAVRMRSGSGVYVSDGASGLGDGLIQVLGKQELTLGPLATAGGIVVQTRDSIQLQGRLDAGADGVSVVSTTNDITVSADIVTRNGQIKLDAGGTLSVAASGGGVSGDGVSLIVAEGSDGVGVARVDLDAGSDLDLQYVVTRGALTADAGGTLTLNQDVGTVDNAASSVSLSGSSVVLPMNVIAESGAISITATSGTIETLPDSALLVSKGDGSRDPGIGTVNLSFASGTLEVENVVTLGQVDIDYTGPIKSNGTVNLNRQLGGTLTPIGGLDVNAPFVDQRAEIVARGNVSLGQLGFGTTTLRRDIFTGGGNFLVRNDTILDPRRAFVDADGNQLTFDQIIGLDDDGSLLKREIDITEVHQLAEIDDDDLTILADERGSGEFFVEIASPLLVQRNREYSELFPNLRQTLVVNPTAVRDIGRFVESTWSISIDTTGGSRSSGAITFQGDVGIPTEFQSILGGGSFEGSHPTLVETRQYTGFLSPFTEDLSVDEEAETFANGSFILDRGLFDRFADGPSGLENIAAAIEGTFEFIELALNAGTSQISFEGNLGHDTSFTTESTISLNIESAGGLAFAPGSIFSINSLRIPTDLLQVVSGETGDIESTVPVDGHYFLASGAARFGDARPTSVYRATIFRAADLILGIDLDNLGIVGNINPRISHTVFPTTGTFTSAPTAGGTTDGSTTFSYNGGSMGLFSGGDSFGSGTNSTMTTIGLSGPPGAPPSLSDPASAPLLSDTGSESGTHSAGEATASDEETDAEGDTELASSWSCAERDASGSKLTPAEAAFQSDARGGPYSVDAFCDSYPIVSIASGAPAGYEALSAAVGDFWVDAEQARTDYVLPALAPRFGVTESIGAER